MSEDPDSTAEKGGDAPQTVPLEALLSERGKRQSAESAMQDLRVEMAELKGQVQGIVKPEKTISRATLNQAVEEGKMSQADADAFWERQTVERVKKDVTEEIKTESAVTQRLQGVQHRIDDYLAKVPDLLKDGSEARVRVRAEYDDLVASGLPEDITTQYAALKAVYGASATIGKDKLETHRETGGSGAEPPETGIKLSSREKDYYQKRIDAGAYKDWDEVNKLIGEYANPETRRRAGL